MTRTDQRLGMWSARLVVILAVAYILTGCAWLLFGRSPNPQELQPSEPYLAILEALIVLLSPVMIVLMASIHAHADPDRKTMALVALAHMTACATLTCAVHFLQLTVVRRLPVEDPRFSILQLYPWPGLSLGLDLIAWDLFFGLAMLFGAPVFRGNGRDAAIRRGMKLSGVLCLTGVIAQATGNFWFQYPAIVGYAFVFPAVCVLLSQYFRPTSNAIASASSSQRPPQ
ncbi:MAG: hypothetical protein ACREOU_09320 [Candidatus Eiseniibacteriota bacterium]